MRDNIGRCSVGDYLSHRLEQASVRLYFNRARRLQPNAEDAQGLALRVATVGELDAALERAMVHEGPCLIEVPIDPHDCSQELREWGSRGAAANGRPPQGGERYPQ